MKKITRFLLLLCATLMGATTASAETIKLDASNGLPGTLSNSQYTFETSTLTATTPFKYLRITFFDTQGHNTNADNFKFVCLSEFYLEKEDGTEIALTSSNFSTNATEPSGEGPIANICDDNTASTNYWHSSWSSSIGEYHYLQIALPDDIDAISTYKLKWISRNATNAPLSIAVTTGSTAEDITNEVKTWQYAENGKSYHYLNSDAGLPGTTGQTSVSGQYTWTSDVITFDEAVNRLSFKVIGTNTGARFGGYPFFTLSEFRVYKEDGTQVTLSASNFSANAIQGNDGGGVAALCDNDNSTYLHTSYSGTNPGTYHTLYIDLPEAMQKLKIGFDSRNGNNVPKSVVLEGFADQASGEKAIEEGTYRIVSANTGFGANTKAITGSLNGQTANAGWEGVDENDPEQYWTIAGNETDGYTIQNAHFGDKKYLTTGSTQSSRSTLTNNGTKYKFNYLSRGQYNIFPNGSSYPLHCENQADGYAQSTLTTWQGAALSASAWTLVKVDDVKAAQVSLNSALNGVSTNATVAANAIGTNPGQVNTTMTIEELTAKVNARNTAATTATSAVAGTDVSAMESAYTALVNAKAEIPAINAVSANKYYRLKGVASNNYVVAGAAGSQMNTADLSDDNTASTIFYLDNTKLLSYANGYYVYQTREIGALGNSCTWTFSPNTNKIGTVTLQAGGTTGNVGTWMYNSTNNKVDRNGVQAGDNTNWYVEDVTTLPVSVSAAGYATLYAPVALTIPTGIEAYTASFEDSKVVLTPITGTIPANTGVVLEANEGTYNFDITTTEETATSALAGSAATASVAADANAYILAKGTQGVGFYLLNSDDRTIQGGRAYYTAPASSESAAAFIFGGNATGISTIATAEQTGNASIYDLSGRKVAKTAKGIYIQNGKKFIVK